MTGRLRLPGRALLAGALLVGGLTGIPGRSVAAAPAPDPVAAPAPAPVSRSDTKRLAAANRRSEPQVRRILSDATAKVGPKDRLYYEEPLPPGGLEGSPLDQPRAEASPPYSEALTFALHSRPGSTRVIYLDFDGQTISGTAWNSRVNLPSFDAERFSLDASASFSTSEQEVVQRVWQQVAEDFGPFDVDVTTQDPGDAAITRSGLSDVRFGTRALITNTSTVASACGCAGTAFIGSFDEPNDHAYYQPALIFSPTLGGYPKFVAEAVAHEVGHNLSLAHDGDSAQSYYEGHGSWAPIMGLSLYRPISQWSRGEYPTATNGEDDLQQMQDSGIALLGDDHGNSSASATALGIGPLQTAAGMITTDADVDVFKVRAVAGAATFSVTPAVAAPNLDVLLELRSADGALLGRSDPPSTTVTFERAGGLDASLSVTLASDGDYYVSVSGVGAGDVTTGYSGYASLGRYSLTASTHLPAVTLTAAPNPSTVRQAVTFAAAVSVPAPGRGTPTGTVTFADGTTDLCPAVPLVNGQATCTAAVGAGSRAITATYNGDAAFSRATSPVVTQVVAGDPAAVALASSPSPTVSGQAFTLTATVAGLAPSAPTAGGTVTFKEGSSVLCGSVALGGGRATCTTALGSGSHSLTAVYGGDDWYEGAASPAVTHTTGRAPSAVDLRSWANPSVSGQSFWLGSTVAVPPPGGVVTPLGGTVTFKEGAAVLCSGPVTPGSGLASCMAPFGPGSHILTAEYSGDPEREASTSAPLTQVVTKAEAAVTLSAAPTPSSAGQNVRLEAVVRMRQPGCCTVTGTVTFTAAGAVLCAGVAVTYGTANCNRSFSTGSYDLVATYSGDDRVNGGASPPVLHTVSRPAVTVGLSSSANPTNRGVPVTFSASLTPVGGGMGAPTGTVAFSDGTTELCGAAPISSNRASCTVALGAGSRPITAAYSGDATYALATSAVLTQSVTGEPATVVVTATPDAPVSGQTVTLQAVAAPSAPGGPTPTGVVSFSDGPTVLCRDVILVAGAATCAVPLSAGTHTLAGAYGGDARFNAASGSASLSVRRAASTVAVRASENPQLMSLPSVLSATVAAIEPGAAEPTGTVTFTDGDRVLCESIAVGQSCTTWRSAGTRPITATYSGDGQMAAATSAVYELVILTLGDGFTAVTPSRLLDTRTGLGGGAGPVGPGVTTAPQVRGGATGIPSSATSVMLNITATGPTAVSFLTVYPWGSVQPETSSLNLEPGRTVPNLVPVAVGVDGRVSITNAFGSVQVIVDVVGYFTRTGGSTSTAITPTRLLDTRVGTGGPAIPISGGSTRQLTVRGGATGVPDTATAVVVNMTVTQPTAAGFLTVHPSGVAQPNASSLNFAAGETVPNLVVARIGGDGRISIFNAFGAAHVLADVVAYYAPHSLVTGGATYVAVTGQRLLDTRSGIGGPPVPLGPNSVRQVTVAGASNFFFASAVVLNVTVVGPSSASYLTVFGQVPPNASNLNFGPGQIRTNLVVSQVGSGGVVNIYNEAGNVHVIADIVGFTIG